LNTPNPPPSVRHCYTSRTHRRCLRNPCQHVDG